MVLLPHAKELLEQSICVDNDHKAAGAPTFGIVYTQINLCLSLYLCSCVFWLCLIRQIITVNKSSPKISNWQRLIQRATAGSVLQIMVWNVRMACTSWIWGTKKQGLTQYIPAAFAWLEEESARDLEFSSEMPNGYAQAMGATGIFVDKRVWGQAVWQRVLSEFHRPDSLGVHNSIF